MNRNRLPIDPLWRPKPQSLKARDMRRIQRHALPAFTRAVPYPLDQFVEEQHRRRVLFWLDVACFGMMLAIAICLVLVVMGA